MRLVDMTLPQALVNVIFRRIFLVSFIYTVLTKLTELAGSIATVALVVAVVGYFAIALPFLTGVLYLVQRFYLRTSRQLRLLE